MKTIYKTTPFFLILCLLNALIGFAQPVIKVPQMCQVVVAGTGLGASTGYGGAVGDGGIVVMPDPFDFPEGEGNFYYSSNDSELIQWELFGDLSMQTDSDYNEVVQPIGAVNPVNLQSYNKNLRFTEMPSESQPLLDSRWARSKGRVIVSYKDKKCGGKIKFDVFKRYKYDKRKNLIPPILGADCLLPNTTYTFSVDPIASDNANDEIGFDRYYWSDLPEGSQQLFSAADNSSITFTTGNIVPDFTITCCYGRANDWDGDAGSPHTTCITKQVAGTPAPPNYTAAPPTCLPTGQATFLVVYPDPISGQSYAWSSTNTGWTFNTSTSLGITTLTVNTSSNNDQGQLTLTITGTCNSAIFNYQVNRNITAPLVISPTGTTTNNCIAGNSTGNTYTLSPTTSNNIVWSIGNLVPPNLTGITLENANSATVTVKTTGTATGSFTLYATSGTTTCNTTSVSTIIYVQPPTPAFTIGTPSCVVRSATPISTVAVTSVAGATYDWTPLPAGVTCTACTTASPSFTFNSAAGVNSVILTVKVIGPGSCNSNSATKTINYIAMARNFTGGTFNDQYTISNLCGPVTSWVLTTASGSTTYTASSGNITITGVNNNNLLVSGIGGLALTSVCANLSSGLQVCANMTGATNTQKSSSYASNNGIKYLIKNVVISPNPNSGQFTINVLDYHESASATMTDFSGNEIQTYSLQKGDNKIEKEGLKKGTYLVILKIDGNHETRQIIIK